jgi:hypothetical protein
VSKKLAFVYRAVLVETKAYSRRAELAASMEQDFLQRYFGKNKEILGFAGRIIEQGNKAAARELNNAVRVLGNDLDAETVIRRIDREYLINPSPPPPPSSTFCTLVRKLEARPDGDTYAWDDWVALVELMGGTVYEKSGLFLNTMTVCFGDSEEVFNNGISAVRWIQKHVLPLAMKRVRSGEARG